MRDPLIQFWKITRTAVRTLLSAGLCWLWLLTFAGVAAAQPKPATAAVGARFLFVVETSNAMLPFEHAGRQVAFDFVHSGIDRQMQSGDTIGIWHFGEELHAGIFPMQVWKPEEKVRLASLIGLFLKNQRYDKEGRLDRVIPKLISLIQNVKDVNVLIISGSTVTWRGTAFDREINMAFEKSSAASRAAKRPLVTTLVARKGDLVSWSVSLAGDPISLPKRSAPAPVVQAAAAPLASNALTTAATLPLSDPGARSGQAAAPIKSIVISSKGSMINGALRPEDNSAIVKSITPATEPQPVPPAPAEPKAETKPTHVESASKLAGANTNSATAPIEPQRPAMAVSPTPAVSPGQTSPALTPMPEKQAQLSLPALLPAPLPIAARERPITTNAPGPRSAAPAMAVATPPEPLFTPRTLFLIGVTLTLAALLLLFLALRYFRSAPRPSFITRSFDRDNS